MPEHRQIAAIGGGDVQAALVHGGQQSDGLKGYGLAAGVGTGDDQGIIGVPQLYIDGNGLGRVQQRVTRPAQQDALSFHARLLAVHLVAELGFGKDQVQPHQQIKVGIDILPVLGAVGGELRQDPLDLQLLLGGQLPQLVVGLDSGHGLHEESLPRGRDIMHQTGHRSLVIRLHRDHIAVGSHGDNGLLQRLGVGG